MLNLGELKLNKTLIQKDRGGFQNGPWNGHFEAQGGERRYFTIQLHFHKNGSVDGYGQDQLGKFKVKNAVFDRMTEPHVFRGRLKWENRMEAEVSGTLDHGTSAITGTYTSTEGDGAISMQPTFSGINAAAAASEGSVSPGSSRDSHSRTASRGDLSPASATAPGAHQRRGPDQPSPASSGSGNPPSRGPRRLPRQAALTPEDHEAIRSLMDLGFERRICELAVHNAGTREAQVEWIYSNITRLQEEPEDPVPAARPAGRPTAADEPVPGELVQKLAAMGFDPESAVRALRHHGMNVAAATEALLSGLPDEAPAPAVQHGADPFGNLLAMSAGSSGDPAEPPAALVQQLMEVVQTTDRRRAVAALTQCHNDLELAVNWILEGGAVNPPAASSGFDDFFGSSSAGPPPRPGTRVHFNPQGPVVAANRPHLTEDDLFGAPADSSSSRGGGGGIDDLFGGPSPVSTARPGTAPPPRRAAPAPPKRAPPPPPAAGAAATAPPAGGMSNPLLRPFSSARPTAFFPPPAMAPPDLPDLSAVLTTASGVAPSQPNPLMDPFAAATTEGLRSQDLFGAFNADPFASTGPDPFAAGPSSVQPPSVVATGRSEDLFASSSSDPFAASSEAPFHGPGPTHPSHPDPFGQPSLFGSHDPFSSASGDPLPTAPAEPTGTAPAAGFDASPAAPHGTSNASSRTSPAGGFDDLLM